MNALSLGGEEWHVVAGYGPEAARSPARDAAENQCAYCVMPMNSAESIVNT